MIIGESSAGEENLESFRQLFELRNISGAHSLLQSLFTQFYGQKGYLEISALPLISPQDNSVLFIGATISALKEILLSGYYPPDHNGFFLAQPCLRTNALKYAFDNNWIPYGQIYFSMVANLSKPGRFDAVVREAYDFTRNTLGAKQDRIKFRSTKRNRDLGRVDEIVDTEVEFDSKPEGYYRWVYGIEGVHGEGLTVCLFNPATQKWFDVGNIVKIYDATGNELGTEFGYGYEFLLTALVGVDQALKFSKVYEYFKFETGLSQKYYSTLEAVLAMKLAGAQIGHKGIGHVYKQYLKSLQFIGSSLGKKVEIIIGEIGNYASYIHVEDIGLNEELLYMEYHERAKKEFSNVIKRVGNYLWRVSQGKKPKEIIRDPAGMVLGYLVKNGIELNEVSDIIKKLDRFNIL